jgi:sulfofructose kinase
MASVPKVDVVGVGLNATDTLISVARYPESGSKVEIRSAQILPGGQVASAIIACQQWGLSTRYVGKLGDDHAAEIHRAEFARAGVDARVAVANGCSSQQAFILVDQSGERTVLWKRDTALTLQPEELQREWIVNARALHVDGHDVASAVQAARWAREAGIPIIADLDDVYPGVEQLINKVDYLITSRDIPSRITGETDLHSALRILQAKNGNRLTGATLGHEGVLVWDGHAHHYHAAFQVDTADTTGAGDIFHAGFMFGLLKEWPLMRILEFANGAAALNCRGLGARGGIRTVSEIEAFLSTARRLPAAFP